jgi:transposase
MAMTMVGPVVGRVVTGGVDTHLDVHLAAALDDMGGLLGVESFEASGAGNDKLLGWLQSFGDVAQLGVEGTGSYGANLARSLRAAGVTVVKVDRPNRQALRPVDEDQVAQPDPHLGFTAPDELRDRLRGVSRDHLGGVAAGLRPRAGGDPVITATKTAMRILGRRVLALDEEIATIDALLIDLVAATAPTLLEVHGVGVDTAATLLVAAGDNPQRLPSEAAWAPCAASLPSQRSGKATRWRLNRGGDRPANGALWVVVITRMSSGPRTRAYVEHRLADGRSKPEIIRILKRYVAREVFHHLPRA